MKIQSLAVIFIIIILPISTILTAYTQSQVKTLNLQLSYDTKLNTATYDALKAFQLNTINNSTSDLSNSKIRDIEASVNTFFYSISSNFKMVGYNQDTIKEYVPALVYTMYDGYYIYSKYTNTLPESDYKESSTYQDGQQIYGLKPYIHYSCRYKKDNIDVVITYSLDNFITVEGIDKDGKGIKESGYLIGNIDYRGEKDANGNPKDVKYRNILIEPENLAKEYIGPNNDENNLYEYIKINGVKHYKDKTNGSWFTILNGMRTGSQITQNIDKDYSAVKYYAEAYEFKKRLNECGILDITENDAVDENGEKLSEKESKENQVTFGNYKIFEDDNDKISIEDPNSNFNQHRQKIIRYSIEKNLSIAIANYNNYIGQGKADFQMPALKESEWEKIINNISIISFLQGLNIGEKLYNGYSIITNTKNKEVVTEDSIYIADNETYYNVKKSGLNNTIASDANVRGILNIDFEKVSIVDESSRVTNYYYPQKQLADYTSVINQTNIETTDNIYEYLQGKDKLAKIYYTALGRERKSMYKDIIDANNIQY